MISPIPPSPCGKAAESGSNVVGEREVFKEEWDVVEEEIRKINECDLEHFDTQDGGENDRYTRRQMMAAGGETGRG